MPQTQQYEFREEKPSIISYSEYMLTKTETIYVGQPVQVDVSQGNSGVATEVINQNKVWCKRYSDTTSAAYSNGVATKPIFPVGHPNSLRAGMGQYMRDIALLQFGLIPIFNVGTLDLHRGDPVAPAVLSGEASCVGVQKWQAGMSLLGFCHEYNIPAYDSGNDVVHLGLIFVTPMKDAVLQTSVEKTDSVTTHVHSFAGGNTFVEVLYVFANTGSTSGVMLVPGDPATTQGTYALTDDNTTITTNATDAITEVVIGYRYYV